MTGSSFITEPQLRIARHLYRKKKVPVNRLSLCFCLSLKVTLCQEAMMKLHLRNQALGSYFPPALNT